MSKSHRLILTVFVVSMPVFGCSENEQPVHRIVGAPSKVNEPPVDSTQSAKPKVDLSKTKPDYTMDADSWDNEWKNNSEAAKKKFTGKCVVLTGTVSSVADALDVDVGFLWLNLSSGPPGVLCWTNDRAPWLKVGPGCTIKLASVIMEFGEGPKFYYCDIIESSPNTSLELTADKLAKEFITGKEVAREKYREKMVIIEGELVGKETSEADKNNFIYLVLKGDSDTNIKCIVANNSKRRIQANDDLKIGQKLRICGAISIRDREKNLILSTAGDRMVTVVP